MSTATTAQIQVLTDVHERLQAIRLIPPLLLKPSSTDRLSSQFQLLSQFADTVRSRPVQEALRASSKSFEADSAELNPNLRRESRKRRYVSDIHFSVPLMSFFLQASAVAGIPASLRRRTAQVPIRIPACAGRAVTFERAVASRLHSRV